MEQWKNSDNHIYAITGVVCSALCLWAFGSEKFMPAAMALIVACFLLIKKRVERGKAA